MENHERVRRGPEVGHRYHAMISPGAFCSDGFGMQSPEPIHYEPKHKYPCAHGSDDRKHTSLSRQVSYTL